MWKKEIPLEIVTDVLKQLFKTCRLLHNEVDPFRNVVTVKDKEILKRHSGRNFHTLIPNSWYLPLMVIAELSLV